MKIGTKSVLFGYHCILLHWFFVFLGWHELYGWKRVRIGTRLVPLGMATVPTAGASFLRVGVFTSLWDPRLWLAFLLHDLGYLGKPNMDGPEGEKHPEGGARLMTMMFGDSWGKLCLYHSRFYAKLENAAPSPLCFADKLAICYLPDWLYMRMIFATGEVHEYMANSSRMIGLKVTNNDARVWMAEVKRYAREWTMAHKDGAWDTWTPKKGDDAAPRATVSASGVWK